MTAIALKERLGLHNIMVRLEETYLYIPSHLARRSTTRRPTLVALGSSAPSYNTLDHNLFNLS